MATEPCFGPAGVLALDHVAFGVPSIAGICPALAHDLGGRPYHSGPGIGFRGAQWELADGGRIEAIEPAGGGDGFLHRFLAAGGARIHHLTFKVRDIREAARAAEAHGYRVVGLSVELASWKEMFLHPKEAQGIVVQLAESHPELGDDGWSAAWPFPRLEPGPRNRPRVLGLRLAARSRAQAERQWCELLGGRPSETGEGFRVEWPGSPLRLTIRLSEVLPEGPLGLEVVDPAAVGHEPRPLDVLGCPLIAVAA